MELNSVIFPSRPSSYTYEQLEGRLLFIPRAPIVAGRSNFAQHHSYGHQPNHIPCLYVKYPGGSSKLLLFFHGNAEDIGHTRELLETIGTFIGAHAISVEYPSYGIYAGEPSAERINEDAANVFDYIATMCKWGEPNIIVAGRSIGSGPAIYLAGERKPGALLLVSACTSVKGAVKSVAGSAFQIFVKERFENTESIKKVTCPTFFLHGLKDKLVPYTHSQELHAAAISAPTFLSLPEDMDHASFDYINDLAQPFLMFLMKFQISLQPEPREPGFINFPPSVFLLPPSYPPVAGPGLFKRLLLKLF